jgi:hypothetical protein
MHYFYAQVLGSITSGKIRVLIRSLTNPQIVLITFSYLLGINLNLSWAFPRHSIYAPSKVTYSPTETWGFFALIILK